MYVAADFPGELWPGLVAVSDFEYSEADYDCTVGVAVAVGWEAVADVVVDSSVGCAYGDVPDYAEVVAGVDADSDCAAVDVPVVSR